MRQAGRRMLIVNFAGLGNGIWIVPILKRLEEVDPAASYFHTSNPVFAARGIMDWLGLKSFEGVVPSNWRRFDRDDWGVIRDFLREQNINAVVNLRNEGPFRDVEYFQFKREMASSGVDFWELDQAAIAARGEQRPLFADQLRLFVSKGIDLQDVNRTWVREYLRWKGGSRAGNAEIGFFTGASQSVKRWPTGDWIRLGSSVLCEAARKIVVYAGQTDIEIENAEEIASELRGRFGAGRCTTVARQSFEYLCWHVSGLDLLVSNDTFSVHLGAALDIPVIGLYFATDSMIWGGVSGSFRAVQSRTGLSCPDFKRDAGNCTAFYGGCSGGPCKADVTPERVYPMIVQLQRPQWPETVDSAALIPGNRDETIAACPAS